jgi:hypothetical protein
VAIGAVILSWPALSLVSWMLAGAQTTSFVPSGGSAIS